MSSTVTSKESDDHSPLQWKPAICGICPAGCWVEVGMNNGTMVDIRQDTTHPLGMICRRGEHAPEIVYSENRLRHPMRRVGGKGSQNFEPISWDQAYEIIVENLERIKEESGPEALSIYTGRGSFELSLCDVFQPKGVAVSSASNVLFPFGSPNTMGVGALCYVSFAMIAPHVTMGRMLVNMFTDLENAEMIVVWGANPATDSPPLDMYRLEAAAKRGADIVVIDPRHTETAKRTGAQWLPIRPGSDGALALAMIEVMIEEDLYDDAFATDWCHGFDDLRRYCQHFTAEKAAEITGVPAETIRDLARRIAGATGCSPVMYTGLEYSNSGIQAIRAVLTLWALAGQLDVPGGIGLAMLGTHFPINRSSNVENPDLERAVARDKFPIYSQYRGESHASGLIDAVLHGDPYEIRGLIVHGASLLTSWPQTPIWREALAKLDFLVCIDRQLTADSAYADIVLPASTMFEISSYMVYGPIFRLRERVVEPVGEARNDFLIMAELARRLGYGDQYPQSEEELLETVLEGSGYTLEEVRRAGGTVRIDTPVMEYKKWEKGGLRSDGKPGFDTPTGKFEIASTILDEYGYEPLPKYVEVQEGPIASPEVAAQYPLVFNSGARPHTDFRSQHHGIRGLLKDNPEPVIEMNAEDARQRQIESGDLVEVRSPRGAVRYRARVTEDIVRGAVECNMGGGGPVGPTAWQECNVNELTDLGNYDEISGFPVYKALLCEVVKAEAGTAKSRATAARQIEACGRPVVIATKTSRPKKKIYLDNNATTAVSTRVKEAMLPFLEGQYGNPSSIYSTGRDAKRAVDNARRQVARLLAARPRSIVFTGGGSEADNLAIKGVAFARRDRGNHIITSTVEHPAVVETCRFLERIGYRITWLDVDSYGRVDPKHLRDALCDETILVSIMMANNEVGTLMPIRELASVAHRHEALFHTDAVAAAGKIPIDVAELGVDLVSLSGHKFHAPKGIGALYVRPGVALESVVHGSGQEGGYRAGTENVPATVAMGKAAEIARNLTRKGDEVAELRDHLKKGIEKLLPESVFHGHPTAVLPNTLSVSLPGVRGESMVIALDQHGISLSSGSACKSGSPEPTHVLLAMGKSEEAAHRALRFSLSTETTKEEIDTTLTTMAEVIDEMASTIRFLPCK